MKEFITAVEDLVSEDENTERIAALIAAGKTEDEARAEVEGYIPFKVDGRELRAYHPHEGQLTFMLAALGRGQTKDQRFASIINIMLESLREEDAEYLESRLLTRDPQKRIKAKQIEEIFAYLTEQWFARPTQSQSGSAGLPQTDGQN